MKKTKLTALCLSALTMMTAAVSCTSDPTTIGFNYPADNDSDKATILLNLSVADTRADGETTDPDVETARASEQLLKNVIIYVFDESNNLEKVTSASSVDENNSVTISLAKHGLKTIYAISANQVFTTPPAEGLAMSAFKDLKFPTITLSDETYTSTLKDETNGFVMIGNSKQQMVMQSYGSDIPSTNNFNIELKRVLAKTQVKCPAGSANTGENTSGLAVAINFDMAVPSYKVCQINKYMRVVHNGNLCDSYTSHTAGTCDGYYRSWPDTKTAQTSDFKDSECIYVPENIVTDNICGNKTFLSLCFKATPKQYYSYDGTTLQTTDAPETPGTFYAVGVVNAATGMVDYAVTSNGTVQDIIIFHTSDEATNYAASLNGGTAPAFTVSESDSPLRARAASTRSTLNFQPLEFTDGKVYYRVNLKDEDGKYNVVRNKFYKVSVNKITYLGSNSESLLFPTEPSTPMDKTPTTSIQATFTIAPWDDVEQSVIL